MAAGSKCQVTCWQQAAVLKGRLGKRGGKIGKVPHEGGSKKVFSYRRKAKCRAPFVSSPKEGGGRMTQSLGWGVVHIQGLEGEKAKKKV